MPIVIPAQAGIQEATAGLHPGTLDSRLRGNDGEQLAVNGYHRGNRRIEFSPTERLRRVKIWQRHPTVNVLRAAFAEPSR